MLFSLVAGVAFAAPLAFLVWRNVRAGGEFIDVVTTLDTWRPIGRSLLLALVVTSCSSVVGTGLAWASMRTDMPFAGPTRVLAPLPLVLPSFVAGAALLAAFAPGGLLDEMLGPLGVERLPSVRGFWGSVMALTIISYPYVYLPVAARLNQLPASLEEAARTLGTSPSATFRKVVWPQIAPAIRAGALLVTLYSLSDFGVVALMGYPTVTVRMFSSWLADPELAFALGLMLALVAISLVTAERATAAAPISGVESSSGSFRIELGRWRWPTAVVSALVLVLSIVGPVSVLVWWVWRGVVNKSAGFTGGGGLGGFWDPAWHTLAVGLAAGAVAVIVVLPIALLTARYRSRAALPAATFLGAGFALPGLVIALSVVFMTLRVDALSWLYQTMPLLIFAYVVHFGAQAFRTAEVGVAAADRRLDEVARTLGASAKRRFLRIDLPIMAPVLSAGGGLVMLSTMKELPATLLAAPIGFDTLATRIWNATEDGFLADAALASLILLGASAVLTWLLVIRRAAHLA